MSKIKVRFFFEGIENSYECDKKDKIFGVCQKYTEELGLNINSLLFYYDGKKLNLEISIEDLVDLNGKANMPIIISVIKNENEIIINEENNLLRFEEYKKNYGDKIYKEYNCLDGFLEYE